MGLIISSPQVRFIQIPAARTGDSLQFSRAELQDFCQFEAMRKSEHGYQVALPAVTIIFDLFKVAQH